jgi:hypothetical protein
MEHNHTNQTVTIDPQELPILTERDWSFAESLEIAGYLAYLQARYEGKSHIWAVSIANKAVAS